MSTIKSIYWTLLPISFLAFCAPVESADRKPPTDAKKIGNAITAAPPAISRNATVAEMNEDGSMKVLRKGTNDWTCVPDDASTPGDDPMCLDPNAMEWLHAYMTKAPPPDRVGFIYMLKGGWDFSNTDPFATKPQNGKATITGPHVMVVGPAVKSLPGYDRTGERSQPRHSLCHVERDALRTFDDPGSLEPDSRIRCSI